MYIYIYAYVYIWPNAKIVLYRPMPKLWGVSLLVGSPIAFGAPRKFYGRQITSARCKNHTQ